jgi:hypothetical protein
MFADEYAIICRYERLRLDWQASNPKHSKYIHTCQISSLDFDRITTAVTEPPPKNYDFKMPTKRRLRLTAWLSGDRD